MQIDLEKTVTLRRLMQLARRLKAEDFPAHNVCSEYDRGLVELVTDAAGLSMDNKQDVADLLGVLGRCR